VEPSFRQRDDSGHNGSFNSQEHSDTEVRMGPLRHGDNLGRHKIAGDCCQIKDFAPKLATLLSNQKPLIRRGCNISRTTHRSIKQITRRQQH
jgi:hypothetical protein